VKKTLRREKRIYNFQQLDSFGCYHRHSVTKIDIKVK